MTFKDKKGIEIKIGDTIRFHMKQYNLESRDFDTILKTGIVVLGTYSDSEQYCDEFHFGLYVKELDCDDKIKTLPDVAGQCEIIK